MTKLELKILRAFSQCIIDNGKNYFNTFFFYDELLDVLETCPDNALEVLEKEYGWKPFEEPKRNK
jgi:hypothetical protein